MLFNLGKPDFTRVQYPALLEDWPSLGVLKTIIGVFFFLSTLPIVRGLDIGIFPGSISCTYCKNTSVASALLSLFPEAFP